MSAVEGAVYGWNTHDLVPQADKPYGDLAMRLDRYNVALAYYHNTVYDSLASHASLLKKEERLYKFIRSIVNPVRQENNLFVSYTYRGTVDTQTLKRGSMPLVFENAGLEEPLKQVIKWSNLDTQLGGFVRDAVLLGDTAWWIVDDPYRRRVRLELVDPARIKYVERDEVGNVKAAVIEWRESEAPDVEAYKPSSGGLLATQTSKTYIKSIKVTREKFETFKDGKPWPFYRDVSGNMVSEWDNVYGFVPLKLACFQPGKDGWGQNSFFGTPRRQIDEINDQASLINDSIRNVVVPILQAVGMSGQTKITMSNEEKDGVRILYLPNKDAELKAVTIPLDITAATANRAVLVSELEKNMPVLSLQRIRDIGGNLSGVAIRNLFGDAVSTVENVRKNLNPALVSALQMAVSIGAIQGYEGFGGFNADSYDAGDMELSIGETPVIEDQLSLTERLDKIISIAVLPEGSKRQALTEMGFSDIDVDKIITEDAVEKEQNIRNAARGLAGSVFGDEDEDEDDDNEDTEADTEETPAREETDPRPTVAA